MRGLVPPFLMLGVGCLMLGCGIGMTIETIRLRAEAIKHNAAHYDAKTGAFTWNDERIEK